MKLNKQITLQGDIIGLDLGMSRTGVARLHTVARIAQPLEEIQMQTTELVDAVQLIVDREGAQAVVVGIPRNLVGNDTEQTRWSQAQFEVLKQKLTVPVFTCDEAGTTVQAEKRAKPGESVDSVAAGIILEDFIDEVSQGKVVDVSL